MISDAFTSAWRLGRCWNIRLLGCGFQHLLRGPADAKALKIMFDPHIEIIPTFNVTIPYDKLNLVLVVISYDIKFYEIRRRLVS